MNIDLRLVAGLLAASLLTSGFARGQEPSASASASPSPSPSPSPAVVGEPTLDDTIEAGEADSEEPARRRMKTFNEYEGPYFTIRVGAGLLYEGAAYSQDEASEAQFPELEPDDRVRDSRFIIKGRLFPKLKRQITFSAAIMYD